MKTFLDLARSRKTTHDFLPRMVKQADLGRILEAGRWAPSSLNLQPWDFLVVKEKSSINLLISSSFYGVFHSEPPVVVAVVLRREYFRNEPHRGVKGGRIGSFEAMLSVAMPVLQMALQAQELGLGTCILTVDEKAVAKRLGLRSGDSLPIAIGIGHNNPKAKSQGLLHRRKPLSPMVHKERFKG